MKQLQLSNTAIADLCQQLALLIKAGVRLSDGLFLLSQDEITPSLQAKLSDMAVMTEQGALLSEAFEQTNCFPSHVIGLLNVGEQVGRTEETLLALSRYYTERERIRRRLKNTLIFPVILFVMMLAVIVVLLTQVLPIFNEVYLSLGQNMTGLAAGLLTLGNVLSSILPLLGIVLCVLVLSALFLFRIPVLRIRVLSFWQLHFADRGIFHQINNAHFAQALSMALNSGLPLEKGVSLAGALLKDCPAAVQRCEVCRTCLDQGIDLATALGESHLLPASACRMLALGMKAGTGDTTMDELSLRLSEEVSEALEAKTAMIEPALVLITSVLVGLILLSVMLPLIHIMKAIG